MTTYQLGPVIGTLGGGGRESQEFENVYRDQPVTVGEGRWLIAASRSSIVFDGTFTNGNARVVEGPAVHTVGVQSGQATVYVAPLTD